jgi:geranylgeranyl transferase type-2 subunit alpha
MYHGRKREPKVIPTEEQKKANAELLAKIQKINQTLLQRRVSKQYNEENLELTEKAAALFTDNYTVWNYRREIIMEIVFNKPEKTIEDKEKFIISELKLLLKLLTKNQKSFPLWFHRQWCIVKGIELNGKAFEKEDSILKNELKLCAELLVQDGRNFHCWNYKAWLLELERENINKMFNEPEKREKALREMFEREYNYTTQLISKDFSNYSTWYYRSKMLPYLFPDTMYLISIPKIKEELETLKQALYTEPKDQSCWNHHRWLVSLVLPVQIIGCSIKLPINDQLEITLGLSHKIKNLEGIEVNLNGDLAEVKMEAVTPAIHTNRWIIKAQTKEPINEVRLKWKEDAKCPTIEGPRVIRPLILSWKKEGEVMKLARESIESALDKVMKEITDGEIEVLEELIEVEEGLVYAIERLCELYSLKRDYFGNPYYGFMDTCYLCREELKKQYEVLSGYKKGTAAEVMYNDLATKYKNISDLFNHTKSILEGKEVEKLEVETLGKNIDLNPYLVIC